MTAAAFDEYGWLKTGDLFYRDEYHNYFFFDRIKMLLKYRNHQVKYKAKYLYKKIINRHP